MYLMFLVQHALYAHYAHNANFVIYSLYKGDKITVLNKDLL